MKAPKDLSRFTKKEMDAVFQAAFSIHKDEFITILASRPSIKEYGRALFITPKKIGNAPQRNKIRRRIKSIIRENNLYEQKQDVVFIIKSLSSNPSFEKIKKIVLHAYENKKNNHNI